MSYCFLYNPSTNREQSSRKFRQLKELTVNWPNVDYKTSESREHLTFLAEEAAQNFEVVVACGGDGTVRDIAVAIMGSQAKLGVIPLGSGNDFSKSIGLNTNLEESLNVLQNGNCRHVAIGKCNDFYFINTLGFGFDGQTNHYASQSKIRIGSLRYALAALKTNFKRKPFKAQVRYDDKDLKEQDWIMIAVANGRVEGGNFIIAPDATPFDEQFRLVTISPISKWLLPFLLPLFIIDKQRWLPYYSCTETKNISLNFNRPVFIHSDGEQIFSKKTQFEIRILPSAMPVIC